MLRGPLAATAELLGELADRSGTSVPALLGGVGVLLLALAVGAVSLLSRGAEPPELSIPYATTTLVAPAEPEPAPGPLLAHAAGAVRSPGVYQLDAGARVLDLLLAAGGPDEDADLDRLNLAAPVSDGARVYVPRIGEEQVPELLSHDEAAATVAPGADRGGLLDLNRASSQELETLPGIGPATAAAIVEHRQRHGPFASVEELLDVRGIGPAKLAALRDLVRT